MGTGTQDGIRELAEVYHFLSCTHALSTVSNFSFCNIEQCHEDICEVTRDQNFSRFL